MRYASSYVLMRLAISLAVLRTSSDAERDLEILALRRQVAVMCRQVKRPDLMPADRMILAAIGRRLPHGRMLFSPAMLLRWHQERMRKRWSAFRFRPRRARPPISDELRKTQLLRVTPAPSFASVLVTSSAASTISPSMLISISLLTMNRPSSMASKFKPKSLRLIRVCAA